MSSNNKSGASYADAGVSIDRGNALVDRIKSRVKATERSGVLGGLGGFGALFDISSLDYREPVLVSGTDGVGTKIKLAIESGRHDTIGIDLVAMCVNDLLVQGAEPLFFLDYFACSRLDVDVAEQVISGIAKGCELAGCALVGGETAEMPGMYQEGEYDLAGFCVGAVEKSGIIDGTSVAPGDVLLALASSGVHSNGYSLVRHLVERSNTDLGESFQQGTLLDALLEPTRIYIKSVHQLLGKTRVKAISHITGGGLLENIPRVVPAQYCSVIDRSSWQLPEIFQWLQQAGRIDDREMLRTFNCGVGLVLAIDRGDVDSAMQLLKECGEKTWVLGEIKAGEGGPAVQVS